MAPTDIDAQSSGSGPESLDLDYDDWEGQFEFVGPSAAATTISSAAGSQSQRKGRGKKSRQHVRNPHASSDGLDEDEDEYEDDDDDDLNLSVYVPNDRRPVLYDEETFLSLNPNDFEEEPQLDSIVPAPVICIEDCRATLMKKSNLDGLNNNSGRKYVSAKFHAEELNNIKNRLLADELSSIKGNNMKPNNQLSNNHNNEFAADLCENLTEQVGGSLSRQRAGLAGMFEAYFV